MDYTPPPFEDVFTAEKLFCQGYSYTYDDIIFLPHYIDFPTDAVQLTTRLSRNVPLNIPCVASLMDTVSEAHMAVAMDDLGCIIFIHSNTTPSNQAAMVHSAKSHRVPILSSPVFKPPFGRIELLDDFGDLPYVLVTESGTSASKLLGYVSKLDWQKLDNKEVKVYDYMVNSSDSVPSSFDLEQLYSFLEEKKSNFMPLMNDEEVLDLVTKEDVESVRIHVLMITKLNYKS